MPFNWQQLLELAPLALAKPGSPQAAALMQGYLQSKQRIEQQQRQQRLDTRQGEYQRAQIRNMEVDNARAENQARLARLSAFYQVAPKLTAKAESVAEDPVQANLGLAKQLTGLAGELGVDPAQGMAFIPNMVQAVSARKKKLAEKLYADAEKTYGKEAMATDSITLLTGAFGQVKPSALRQMFVPAIGAEGQPAAPMVPPVSEPMETVNEGGRPILRPRSQAAGKEAFRSSTTEPRARFSLQTVTNTDGSTSLIRINTDTGETTRVTLPTGVAEPGKPATGGLGSAQTQIRNQRAAAALNQVERLKQLAPRRSPGPRGMVEGAAEVAKGYAGLSTKTRQFQALLQPTAMLIAVAVQGAANLSDTERKAMADMLGSISTMDYESQMALLDQATDLLKNAAQVEKIGQTWRAIGRAGSAAPASSPSTDEGWIDMGNGTRVRRKP